MSTGYKDKVNIFSGDERLAKSSGANSLKRKILSVKINHKMQPYSTILSAAYEYFHTTRVITVVNTFYRLLIKIKMGNLKLRTYIQGQEYNFHYTCQHNRL